MLIFHYKYDNVVFRKTLKELHDDQCCYKVTLNINCTQYEAEHRYVISLVKYYLFHNRILSIMFRVFINQVESHPNKFLLIKFYCRNMMVGLALVFLPIVAGMGKQLLSLISCLFNVGCQCHST